ncbi:hypothetical protein pb186bvf_016436 [Paramecium bursaria]
MVKEDGTINKKLFSYESLNIFTQTLRILILSKKYFYMSTNTGEEKNQPLLNQPYQQNNYQAPQPYGNINQDYQAPQSNPYPTPYPAPQYQQQQPPQYAPAPQPNYPSYEEIQNNQYNVQAPPPQVPYQQNNYVPAQPYIQQVQSLPGSQNENFNQGVVNGQPILVRVSPLNQVSYTPPPYNLSNTASGHRLPVQIKCPYCHVTTFTQIESSVGGGACLWTVIVLLLCWPCFFIPLIMDDCRDIIHRCASCGSDVGQTLYKPCG